ncbi:MAG: hypothetical protein M3Q79_02210 [bacterium]|nr:hypothetical protein [bacterium]
MNLARPDYNLRIELLRDEACLRPRFEEARIGVEMVNHVVGNISIARVGRAVRTPNSPVIRSSRDPKWDSFPNQISMLLTDKALSFDTESDDTSAEAAYPCAGFILSKGDRAYSVIDNSKVNLHVTVAHELGHYFEKGKNLRPHCNESECIMHAYDVSPKAEIVNQPVKRGVLQLAYTRHERRETARHSQHRFCDDCAHGIKRSSTYRR